MSVEKTFRAAVAAHRGGDLRSAEYGYRAALAEAPDLVVGLDNLANILAAQGRLAELVEVHQRLLEIRPSDELHTVLGTTLLILGRYQEGWAHYEHRPQRRSGAPKTKVPEWQGEPLAGKNLVIWQEQGFGDQIQMARYAPLLDAQTIQFACLPPLTRLLDQVCATAPRLGGVTGRFDYWVSSMSLPLRFATTVETVPAPARFSAKPRLSGGVGVVARGSPHHANDANRSLPEEQAAQLLRLPNAMSLAPEDTGAADFLETAEIVAGLDVVVCVDTAIAHLAASLGKPVFLLLSSAMPDWRWMRQRTDSPWYDSVRIFRQPEPGNWAAVIEAVRAEL